MIKAKGSSWDGAANGTSDVFANIGFQFSTVSADGALSNPNYCYIVDKTSAATLTLAAPTAVVDDGKNLKVFAASAYAHKVAVATDGFNAKGSDGTATFDGTYGSNLQLFAYNGHWMVDTAKGVTIA